MAWPELADPFVMPNLKALPSSPLSNRPTARPLGATAGLAALGTTAGPTMRRCPLQHVRRARDGGGGSTQRPSHAGTSNQTSSHRDSIRLLAELAGVQSVHRLRVLGDPQQSRVVLEVVKAASRCSVTASGVLDAATCFPK